MIKYNLKSLMQDKTFKTGKKLTYADVCDETGVSLSTLSKMGSNRLGYYASLKHVEKLCTYFQCSLSDFVEIVKYTPFDRKSDKNQNVE